RPVVLVLAVESPKATMRTAGGAAVVTVVVATGPAAGAGAGAVVAVAVAVVVATGGSVTTNADAAARGAASGTNATATQALAPGRSDERHRQQAEGGQPAVVQPRVELGAAPRHDEDRGQGQRSQHDGPRRPPVGRGAPAPFDHGQGHEAPGQELGGAGEGAVV